MKKILNLLSIGLLIITITGCNKKKDEVKQPNNDTPVIENSVPEKTIKEGKIIKAFNIFKNEFESPKKNETTKRTISDTEDLEIMEIYNGAKIYWSEATNEGSKVVADNLEDAKFKPDMFYEAQIHVKPKNGYKLDMNDSYTCDNYYLNGIKCVSLDYLDKNEPDKGYFMNFLFPKTEK